jgi:hypothetical protein
MKYRSVKKNPGCSWIEVNKQVHFFIVGDSWCLQTQENYAKLINSLQKWSRDICPAIDLFWVEWRSRRIKDVTKIRNLELYLSWMGGLFLYFNLWWLSSHQKNPVFNIVAWEIIAKDANYFYHFRDGWCSSGDYSNTIMWVWMIH